MPQEVPLLSYSNRATSAGHLCFCRGSSGDFISSGLPGKHLSALLVFVGLKIVEDFTEMRSIGMIVKNQLKNLSKKRE